MRPQRAYKSSEASSFIWKDPFKTIAFREAKVDLISMEQLPNTQKQANEVLRILAAKIAGETDYLVFYVNEKAPLVRVSPNDCTD